MKKIVIFGGGSGLSQLLKGIKLFPVEITAVVSVADNGGSTGRTSVKTGDDTPIGVWVGILAAAVVIGGAAGIAIDSLTDDTLYIMITDVLVTEGVNNKEKIEEALWELTFKM